MKIGVLKEQAAGERRVALVPGVVATLSPAEVMVVTGAGTVRPASVLVLGAGVAGLQALGTARRLGAVVTGYDVRRAARAEVQSVGARFLDLASDPRAGGTGGYARELTDEERAA